MDTEQRIDRIEAILEKLVEQATGAQTDLRNTQSVVRDLAGVVNTLAGTVAAPDRDIKAHEASLKEMREAVNQVSAAAADAIRQIASLGRQLEAYLIRRPQ